MKHTIRQLEIFVCIARTENVSRAAKTLALSQSAASTALSDFERQFDCQLFDRVGRLLKINELGKAILPIANAILSQANEIETVLLGKVSNGLVKVGATSTIGNYLVMFLIGSYMKEHQDCQVELDIMNTERILHNLIHYEIDLGLIEGVCQHPELIVEPWIADELVVFCAPGHALAKIEHVSLNDLTVQTWILKTQTSGTRQLIDHAMKQHGLPLNTRLVLEHTEAIKSAVESGLGVSCLSRLALRDSFERGTLVPIETPMLNLRRQFSFVWHKRKYQTTCTQQFLQHCRDLNLKLYNISGLEQLPSLNTLISSTNKSDSKQL